MNPVRRATLIGFAAAALAGAPLGAQAAPSFDCKRASTIVEKEICGVPELGDLDRDVAAVFAQAIAALSATDADVLRADERAWLKDRDNCGDLIHGDPPIMADVYVCLKDQMSARVTRLKAILARKQYFK
jgi:uncharacterized protein YecT (DUF1311 family)